MATQPNKKEGNLKSPRKKVINQIKEKEDGKEKNYNQ